MEKHLAEKLLPLVNNKPALDALILYQEFRISRLKDDLASAVDFDTVKSLQGAVQELKKLSNLRDQVISAVESK